MAALAVRGARGTGRNEYLRLLKHVQQHFSPAADEAHVEHRRQSVFRTVDLDVGDHFRYQLQGQGLNLEQYMQWTGMDEQKMLDSMKPQATKRIQSRLVMEAVAKAENIEVTDEEVDAEIGKMAESYGVDVETLKNYMGEDQVKGLHTDLMVQKAIDLVRDAAVEVEKTEEEPKEAEEE